MKKRFLAVLLIVALAAAMLAGCGQEAVEEAGQEQDSDQVTVGLVIAGGLGDRSFYDSADQGVKEAVEDLGVKSKVYECRNDPGMIKDQLVQASETSDIVAVVGFEFYDAIQEVAQAFPDVDYIYVDNELEGIDNIISISYAENEGSFLAGALAAMMTKDLNFPGMNPDKKIAMIGGEDNEVINNFYIGYKAGAEYIDPEMDVAIMYSEDYEDPAKGKEIATVLYNKGYDIIFQVAGKTGEGVFEAAAEQGMYAIGVDSDQRYIKEDRIIASMKKEVGRSIYDAIKAIEEDKLERGKVIVYGLREEGVGMGYGDEGMEELAPAEYRQKVDLLREQILTGDIVVPTFKD